MPKIAKNMEKCGKNVPNPAKNLEKCRKNAQEGPKSPEVPESLNIGLRCVPNLF